MPIFSTPIKCPKCKATGSATWDGPLEPALNRPRFMLMSVSDGFYERAKKQNRSLTEIVCGTCGTIVPHPAKVRR